jgi:Ca2+-binding EF-hand superfamily protein
LYDADGTGHLDADELSELLASLGMESSGAQAAAMLTGMDHDGDGSGSVAHSEFTEGLRRFGISMTEEEMTILVEELDHDRDGSISLQEFTHLLKSVHEREHDVAQLH